MKNSFSDWLTSSELGRYLLEREQAYFDRAVADVFGFHAVQLGLPEVDFLRANRIPWQCRVAASGPAHIACNPEQLPFESRSLDLLVMPHVLDFTTVPHQVLREAERVLMPEGRLILTGFNPVSLWGVRRLIQGRAAVPWSGHFLSLVRIKDWLTLLELEPAAGGFMAYAPPFSRCDWVQRFGFMERAGDRWWPLAAGVYGIEAVKRQRGMRLILPSWKQAKAKAGLAVAAGNERHHSHRGYDTTDQAGQEPRQ
ncbi:MULTISPECIES: class I SAM-dependent methyltransferase [Chromobacterium]|uniref:Class I SAM-dependent methyltransferase n=1 Tax=Chromobacterium aquaticum TaxID=467180 RepID=A0ABV8ZUC6_9NEIS|nr:methyltransferase domain-containing protein [Chromobacterium aquaticum]MCD5360862.1 methyltransferase domain-containing protein [Chromobacterium aquaticum]